MLTPRRAQKAASPAKKKTAQSRPQPRLARARTSGPPVELVRLARERYLECGQTELAAEELGLPPNEVEAWAQKDNWDQLRAERLGDPRGAARSLRGVLESRVAAVVAAGTLNKDLADEIAKIGNIIAKLEGSGFDLKAAAVEVGERLAAFASTWEAAEERRSWLADLLSAFFSSLEMEA